MADNGVQTAQVGQVSTVDDLLGNKDGSTGRIPVNNLATQLVGSGPVSARLNEIEGQITSSQIAASTWTSLITFTPVEDGTGGEVLDSDGGTHSQASATGYDGATVANAGRYRWKLSWGRWVRIGDTGLAAKANTADLAPVAFSGELGDAGGDTDDLDEGTTNLFLTAALLSKLNAIEAGADVTDLANVSAAALTALFASALNDVTTDSVYMAVNGQLRRVAFDDFVGNLTGEIDSDDVAEGTTNLYLTAALLSKLNVIEHGADVTDLANVAAALLTSLQTATVNNASTDSVFMVVDGSLRRMAFDDFVGAVSGEIAQQSSYTMTIEDEAVTPNQSPSTQTTYYTEIGQLVVLQMTGLGTVDVTGMNGSDIAYIKLPVAAQRGAIGAVSLTGVPALLTETESGLGEVVAIVSPGSDRAFLRYINTIGGQTVIRVSDLDGAGITAFGLTYFKA
ncbi:hypothetical protein LA6_003441 [Marinibacterium anthonyi]|nr:hypothetical protein LA6_003441 [Marinibacterium anthonyi]